MRLIIWRNFILLLTITIIVAASASQAAAFVSRNVPVLRQEGREREASYKKKQVNPSTEPIKSNTVEKSAPAKIEPEKVKSSDQKEVNPWLYWSVNLLIIIIIIAVFIFLLRKLKLELSRKSVMLLICIFVVFFIVIMVINYLAGKGQLNYPAERSLSRQPEAALITQQSILPPAKTQKIKSNVAEKQPARMGLRPTQ